MLLQFAAVCFGFYLSSLILVPSKKESGGLAMVVQ